MVVLAQWFSIFCFCCFCSEKCFTLLKITEDPQRVFLYRLYLLVFSVFEIKTDFSENIFSFIGKIDQLHVNINKLLKIYLLK